MTKFLWMGWIALMASGCGELSYKRGASTQDLEVSRAGCQSFGSGKAFDKCLEDNGWVVKKWDDVDLFAVAGVSPNNRNPAAAPTTSVAAQSVGTSITPTSATPPPPADPMDTYTIKTWFKPGAGREVLEADTNDCAARLGEAHQPDNKTQQVTRAFVICMHGKGWKALKGD